MPYSRIFIIVLLFQLIFLLTLGTAIEVSDIKINWNSLQKFIEAVKEVKKLHYVTFDSKKTICTMPKAAIQELMKMLTDPEIHPLKKLFIMQNLYGLPISPVKSIINWNEAYYRQLQRMYDVKLSKDGDEELRTIILLHENDEADSSEMYDDTASSVGEQLSSIIAFALTCQLPEEIDYAIGGFIKEKYLPLCVVPGLPSLYHIIKTAFLDKYIGDPIDGAIGQCRSLALTECGVACQHIDPYVLINESNRAYYLQTKSAREFVYKMRETSGELAALRAAGIDYGNEFNDPSNIRLRRAVNHAFSVGGTFIRNLY